MGAVLSQANLRHVLAKRCSKSLSRAVSLWGAANYFACAPCPARGGDFEAAWRVFSAKRTEADFQAWRDQRDWTAEKYRRFDRGERMPHDWQPSG
jgi:hypothetical protein